MNYSVPTYFGLFLPLVVLVYQLTPQKHRWSVLLGASWVFFWSISSKLLIYLVASIVSIHYFGLWMASVQQERTEVIQATPRPERKAVKAQYTKRLKRILTCALMVQLGMLLVLKYTSFFCENAGAVLHMLHCPIQIAVPKFVIPIGISFYTMQAMSYLWDVYYERISVDRILPRLALYMSFFPTLMEGPICHWSEVSQALWSGERVSYHSLTFGAQRILWGLAKKLILADRLDLLVKTVFTDYATLDGGMIALGMVCYTYQLYMDFSGTIDIVIGSAEIFGVTLPENFRQPFFSTSISEFWRRWHITLGGWFRDYIFYPVSFSPPMKALSKRGKSKGINKHLVPLCTSAVALFCVWSCNGLWHGAAWNYIFFGMYHFILIFGERIIELVISAPMQRDYQKKFIWRAIALVRTMILVNIGELFFRALSFTDGVAMLKKMLTAFRLSSFKDKTYLTLGLDGYDFIVLLIGLVVVLLVSIQHEKGLSIREELSKMHTVPRWLVWYALLFAVLLFGAYGMNYAPVDPIYAGF